MTINIPTPSADLLAKIGTATIETKESETAAIAAIRERFTQYAKHNGHVRIANYEAGTCNWSVDRSVYYKDASGKPAKALLACDDFTREKESQNSGSLGGRRLYLLASGEWLEIKRAGSWSAWQGSPNQWGCGVDASPNDGGDGYGITRQGYAEIRTDAEVAASWSLDEILKDLGQAMVEMSSKLPERHGKLKARAELARRVMEAAKGSA